MDKLLIALILLPIAAFGQTLEQCQHSAERNYPLIRQYDLIAKTTDLTLGNISKNWLPQVTASAQATLQSDVTAFPESMQSLYRQMGIDMRGLKKDQYRIGIDLQQTVYDGGAIKSQKELARAQGEVETLQTEVTLYQVRKRVNEMFFAILLLDGQIQLNTDLAGLLSANEKKLQSMYEKGTAAQSDYLNIKAERLNVQQQLESLQARRDMAAKVMSVFCGIPVTAPVKPEPAETSTAADNRPELRLFDAQLRHADARERALNAAILPKLGLFAQGYYGYPGMNMFEDMMRRRMSLNGLLGLRLTWNLGALYTRHNDKAKIQLSRQSIENNRDVFLLNKSMDEITHEQNISRFKNTLSRDDEIIALRERVRFSTESKLNHGIIDIYGLLREINAENTAKLQKSIHEIELLKEIYDLKFTTNN